MEPKKITYRIEKSRRGIDTIIVTSDGKDVPLHSRFDPESEASTFGNRLDPDRYDLVIVLGVGLGYHLVPLGERINEYYAAVLVDLLPELGDRIRDNPLTSFLVRSPKISLLSGKPVDEVVAFLSDILDMDRVRGISVLEHPASARLFGDYYSAIKKSIDDMIRVRAGNKATRQAFGRLFVRNIIKNFGLLGDAMPVRDLFGAFAGYPAVIAGSGPSLDGDLHSLARYQDRMFVVAVDSALPALRGAGITPDIIVSVDPQPYVREHFMDSPCGDAIRVFSISSHPSVASLMSGYFSLNSHPFSQFAYEAYGGSIGSIDSATGNVAGEAVDLCLKCGFSVIGITGFDFSFTDFVIYARGTAYQRRYATYFQDRLSTVESRNASYIMTSSGGHRQEGRLTRKSFLHYRSALEDYIGKNAVRNLRSLNDRGMSISGVRAAGMEELSEKCKTRAIDKRKAVTSVRARSKRIGSGPLREAIAGTDDFLLKRLLDASFGKDTGPGEVARCRNLLAAMELRSGGK